VTSPDNNSLLSTIATRYDFLNHLLSLNIDKRWRSKLVKCAEVKPGESTLDVCSGTGDIVIRLAQSDGVGKIVGIDLSEEMLSIARQKTKRNGFGGKIKLLKGNVLNLPFKDRSFDIVSIGFGLRNLADRKRGTAEMVRILKDGGRLLILEFSPPPVGFFGAGYRLYLNTIIPVVGEMISGSTSAYRYLSASIANFLKPEEIMKLLEGEKLKNICCKALAGGIAYIYRGER
jgi:demethylmenaquinone methyltransferase/2-methoxy-6-polyprenyl-1,4-benzoquinol methylase